MKVNSETHLYGIKAIGRAELRKYIGGQRLTKKQAILARCYECMGGFTDGKYSCRIVDCSLYPFMPYRDIERGD